MSPFCVLATSGSDGSVDASPRGGNPGFVHVAGPNQLLMPDRSGNNRIDSFPQHRRRLGLRAADLLRAGHRRDAARRRQAAKCQPIRQLMASMVEFGKPPRAVLRIERARGLFPLRQGA